MTPTTAISTVQLKYHYYIGGRLRLFLPSRRNWPPCMEEEGRMKRLAMMIYLRGDAPEVENLFDVDFEWMSSDPKHPFSLNGIYFVSSSHAPPQTSSTTLNSSLMSLGLHGICFLGVGARAHPQISSHSPFPTLSCMLILFSVDHRRRGKRNRSVRREREKWQGCSFSYVSFC